MDTALYKNWPLPIIKRIKKLLTWSQNQTYTILVRPKVEYSSIIFATVLQMSHQLNWKINNSYFSSVITIILEATAFLECRLSLTKDIARLSTHARRNDRHQFSGPANDSSAFKVSFFSHTNTDDQKVLYSHLAVVPLIYLFLGLLLHQSYTATWHTASINVTPIIYCYVTLHQNLFPVTKVDKYFSNVHKKTASGVSQTRLVGRRPRIADLSRHPVSSVARD